MAAAATTVTIVAAGEAGWAPWQADSAFVGSKSLKWAYVACTVDTGQYATSGSAVDILGALDDIGWTKITGGYGATYTTNSALHRPELNDPNNTTASSRKVIWRVIASGAELANSTAMTAGTYYMSVWGY